MDEDRVVLEDLVSAVKDSERQEMLKKLKNRNSSVSQEVTENTWDRPPIDEQNIIDNQNIRRQTLAKKYDKLTLLQKFFVLCKQIFKRIDFNQAVESSLMEHLRNSLSLGPQPMLASDGFSVTNFFADQIALLNEAANQLKVYMKAINSSNEEEPGDFLFYAFEELFPDTSMKFRNSITLSHFITEDVTDVAVIKRQLNDVFSQFLYQFPPQSKERLQAVAKDFRACQQILNFSYLGLINKLIINRSSSSLSEDLKSLSIALAQFSVKFDCDFFQLLSGYYLKKEDKTVQKDRKEIVDVLNGVVNSVKRFKKIVPIDDLVAFSIKDPAYSPDIRELNVNDWMEHFRNCLSRYREQLQEKYANLINMNNIITQMKESYELETFPYLKGYLNENWSEVNVTIIFEKTLAFCKYFISSQMNGINAVVKPMLAEGMFYKQENKTALTNVYNKTRSTLEYINEIEKMFSKNGSIFKNLKAAYSLSDTEVLNSNSNFLHNILDMKEIDISREIQEFAVNLDVLEKLFTGFLYGESSESYDTISNLKSFKTVNNKEFIENSKKLIEDLRLAKSILSSFYNLEKTALD